MGLAALTTLPPGGSGSFRLSGPPSSGSLGLLGVSDTSIALALQPPSPTEWHLALGGRGGRAVPGCWLAWLGGCGDWQKGTPSLTAWVFPEWLLLHGHFSGQPPLPFSYPVQGTWLPTGVVGAVEQVQVLSSSASFRRSVQWLELLISIKHFMSSLMI